MVQVLLYICHKFMNIYCFQFSSHSSMHSLVHSLSFLLSGILNNTLTLSYIRPNHLLICQRGKLSKFKKKIASTTLISIIKFQKCNNKSIQLNYNFKTVSYKGIYCNIYHIISTSIFLPQLCAA